MYTVRRLDRFKSKYPNLFFGLRPFDLRERFFSELGQGSASLGLVGLIGRVGLVGTGGYCVMGTGVDCLAG